MPPSGARRWWRVVCMLVVLGSGCGVARVAESPAVDLAVAATTSLAAIPLGETVVLTVTVIPRGAVTLGAEVQVNLPAGWRLRDARGTHGTLVSPSADMVVNQWVALADGECATLWVLLQPAAPGAATLAVRALSPHPDPLEANSTVLLPVTVLAARAIRPGFDDSDLPAGDDLSSDAVDIGFPLNFFGVTGRQLFVNMNGNVTLDQPQSYFSPYELSSTRRQILAPFFADVDTRSPGSDRVRYGPGVVEGRPAFGVTWSQVGYFAEHVTPGNSFQLVLIDRADLAPGAVDVEFNYNRIGWEAGDASGGVDGLGGQAARVGLANGTGLPGTFAELPGSGVPGGLLDTNLATGLIHHSLNAAQPGRYVFPLRDGGVHVADVRVTMDGTPATVSVDGQVTYSLRVTNEGPGLGEAVTLVNLLPADLRPVSVVASRGEATLGTNGLIWVLGQLAVGETGRATLIARAVEAPVPRTSVNVAFVTSSTPDPAPANNTAEVTTAVVAPPIIHVRTGGHDAADGLTWATAKRTVAAGARAANAGGIVWVAAGEYAETLTFLGVQVRVYGGFAGDETDLAARDWRAQPTVLRPVGEIRIAGGASVTLDGLVICDGTAGALACTEATLELQECVFARNGGRFYGGALALIASTATVRRCTFTQNEGVFGGAICSWDSVLTVDSSLFAENVADFGGGISVTGGTALLRNLTLGHNRAMGLGGGLHLQRTTATVTHTIVAFNSSGLLAVSCTPTLTTNDVYGNTGCEYYGLLPGPTDRAVDPMLDATYHLQRDSPCRDAGDVGLLDMAEWDLDGDPRRLGPAIDLGADEAWPNVPPQAVPETYALDEDTVLQVASPGVLANDLDANGDALHALLVSGPSQGTLLLNADGSFSYTPAPDWQGTVTFTYAASDGGLTSSPVAVALTVHPVNDPPTARGDTWTGSGGQPLFVAAPGVLANDTDMDGDPLTALLVRGPARGTLVLTPAGGLTYHPPAGFVGQETCIYRASDGQATSGEATVLLVVEGTPATEVIVDNTDPTGVTLTGRWFPSTTAPGFWGRNYLYDDLAQKGMTSIRFTPALPTSGPYSVYVRWRISAPSLAASVPVVVTHREGTHSLTVNQQQYGGTWVLLGTFHFLAGTSGSVVLGTTGTQGYVIADAVRFLPAATEAIVDNAGSGVTRTGTWLASSTFPGYYGTNYLYDHLAQKGSTTVRFTPALTGVGRYTVFLRWRQSATSLAPNVPVDIVHLAGTTTVLVNQQHGGGTWVPLGTWTFAAGTAGSVLLRTTGTASHLYVIADAVRWVPAP
jgi:uncharacterized repeat protein (TIGR01451 family)